MVETYRTTSGDEMQLPPRFAAARSSATSVEKLAELEAEAERLEVEADQIDEQMEQLRKRRAGNAARRRSLRQTIRHLKAFEPYTPEEN